MYHLLTLAAFPYPAPVQPAPSVLEPQELYVPVEPPSSLRVSIGFDSLRGTHESEASRKPHKKSHHHHHHRKSSTSSSVSAAPVLPAVGSAGGDKLTIPPLRISLNDPSRQAAALPAAPDESTPEPKVTEPKVTELKVAIPFSLLRSASSERSAVSPEEESRASEREHHRKQKKHKKHKERRRHEMEAGMGRGGGGKGIPRADGGGKGVRLAMEVEGRKSYGGKGLFGASRQPHQRVASEGEEEDRERMNTQQFYKQTQHQHQEHNLSHPPTSQPHSSQLHSSQPHSSQPHSLDNKYSDKYYQHKKRMQAKQTKPHTSPAEHPQVAHAISPPDPLTSTSTLTPLPAVEAQTEGPHKQHKKKKKRHKHRHSKSSHETLTLASQSEHSDTAVSEQTVEGTSLDDSTPATPTSEVSAGFGKELFDLRPLSPLPDFGRAAAATAPERERERREERMTVEVAQKQSAKRIRFSDQVADSPHSGTHAKHVPFSQPKPKSHRHTGRLAMTITSNTTSSPASSSATSSPLLPPPPAPAASHLGRAGKGGKTVSVVPLRRRSSSSGQRQVSGKHLRPEQSEEEEEEEEEEVEESVRDGKGARDGGKGYTLVDYDPPPLALEQLQPPQPPQPPSQPPSQSQHPQGTCT